MILRADDAGGNLSSGDQLLEAAKPVQHRLGRRCRDRYALSADFQKVLFGFVARLQLQRHGMFFGCGGDGGFGSGELADGAGENLRGLSYYDNDTVKKVVEAMAEMLKNNLNINVEVSSNEWSIFYDDVQKGNYQVAAMGWSADYVNPMSFLPLCKTGDSSNNLFYSNADYDALVDQVKAENDPAKAAELTLQADAIVSNDYAVLPLYYKSNNYLMHDNISGFYMTASGNLFFKDVKVG